MQNLNYRIPENKKKQIDRRKHKMQHIEHALINGPGLKAFKGKLGMCMRYTA